MEWMEDLDRWVTAIEQAVPSTPTGHGMDLNNLGIAIQTRFEETRSMGELDRAFRILKKAVIYVFDDYPNCIMYLEDLGNSLQSLFEWKG